MTDDAYPVAFHERLDDLRVDGDAAHVFDLGARDRLPIGDERQGFEQCARIFARPVGPEPRDFVGELRADLKAETRGGLLDRDATALVVDAKLLEYAAHFLGAGPRRFVEDLQ